MLAHPAKAGKGEDAFFSVKRGRDSMAMGVADGVGDWSKKGVDAGVFSRGLMERCSQVAASVPTHCPLEILQLAWVRMHDPLTEKTFVRVRCGILETNKTDTSGTGELHGVCHDLRC